MEDENVMLSLIAHTLVEHTGRFGKYYGEVSKYEINKNLLRSLKLAETDQDILKIYGEIYLHYCKSCKLLKSSNPWDCSKKCDLYQVKRECFNRISNGKLIHNFIEELEDEIGK